MSHLSPVVTWCTPVIVSRRFLVHLFLVIGAVSLFGQAVAQHDAAENAAKTFVTHLDTVSPAEIYDTELGPTFTQAVKKDVFISNTGILRIQAGGPALARQLIGGQAFSQMPSGQTGTFYYVRFKTKFPSGFAFQDVYLEQTSNKWKVAGYLLYPAPPN